MWPYAFRFSYDSKQIAENWRHQAGRKGHHTLLLRPEHSPFSPSLWRGWLTRKAQPDAPPCQLLMALRPAQSSPCRRLRIALFLVTITTCPGRSGTVSEALEGSWEPEGVVDARHMMVLLCCPLDLASGEYFENRRGSRCLQGRAPLLSPLSAMLPCILRPILRLGLQAGVLLRRSPPRTELHSDRRRLLPLEDRTARWLTLAHVYAGPRKEGPCV